MTTITFSPFFLLIISICAEVFGTMSLGKSSGFQHIGWGLVALILYGLSFWFLSKVITVMPIAVAYAIWAGLGNVLTVLLAWMLFSQVPSLGTIAGISLIVLGVLVFAVFWSFPLIREVKDVKSVKRIRKVKPS